MAELHPLVAFYVGDEFLIDGCLADKNGLPLDLNGCAIEWKLATAPARQVVLTYTVGTGITVVDTQAGRFRIIVSAEDSAALVAGRYRDQLRVTPPGAGPFTEWVGFIDVKPTL